MLLIKLAWSDYDHYSLFLFNLLPIIIYHLSSLPFFLFLSGFFPYSVAAGINLKLIKIHMMGRDSIFRISAEQTIRTTLIA